MDAPTTKEEPTKTTTADKKTVAADIATTTTASAGSKRASEPMESNEEPPTKKAMTTTSSSSVDETKPKGPPLIPMDLSQPEAKTSDAKDPEAVAVTAISAVPANTLSTATATKPAPSAPSPGPAATTAQPAAPKTASAPAPATAPKAPTIAAKKAPTIAAKTSPKVTSIKTTAAKPVLSKPSTTSRASKKSKDKEDTGGKMKGLRHFSMAVCKKVEEKGNTTYNEVADELVKQVMEERKKDDPNGKFDEKNIRRRVYDSINVLLAMDIIAKDKKQISWRGLPSSTQHDLQLLEREEQVRKEQVQIKRRALQDILKQQICFRNLVAHNKRSELETQHAEKVPMPFVVVHSHKDAVIHCNMAPDLNDVMFEFDRPFDIDDDHSILAKLGMHKTNLATVGDMIPKDMVTYCQEHGLLDGVLLHGNAHTNDAVPALQSVGSGSNRRQYFTSLE